MTDTAQKPGRPIHLWIVGILSLLWNAMGAYDYLMTQTHNEAHMAKFSPEQLEYFYNFPFWVDSSWALAIWGSVLGSILLLIGNRFAVWAFLVSLIAMVATTIYNFGLSNGLEIMGDAGSLIISALIFVISVFLFLYARSLAGKGLLR